MYAHEGHGALFVEVLKNANHPFPADPALFGERSPG